MTTPTAARRPRAVAGYEITVRTIGDTSASADLLPGLELLIGKALA